MAIENSIQRFKESFNGGNRANRFEVISSFPPSVLKPGANEKYKIFASSLPRAELGTIQVPYRGRLLSLAGDRNYSAWAVSVYDDNNQDTLWRSFQSWKEKLDGHLTHQVHNSDFSYRNLQTNWTIKQLDLNGAGIRTITLFKCWPEQVGQLNFDMQSANQSQFSVTLAFDYFEITQGL
jgi:hypothetical protein